VRDHRLPKPITVPAFGMVKGGRLNGWRFHFIQFQVEGCALQLLARCTPPAWPFFREIALEPQHFGTLRAVVGERAKRIPAVPLIATAYRIAGLPVPSWLTAERKQTLRAVVKRSGATKERKQWKC